MRPPTPRTLQPQQPPPPLPTYLTYQMYPVYQTPTSWDTPTWPSQVDMDTMMVTTSPASPSPEGYTPLDHEWKPITPDPPVSTPTIMPDPPMPIPTITPDPPAPSEAYAPLDRLFPAPPDLPECPYNLTWKPLKPDWSCLLGLGMAPTLVMPVT